jgi:hypothetical protein
MFSRAHALMLLRVANIAGRRRRTSMQIKSITIASQDPCTPDIEIAAIEGGVLITTGDAVICEVRENEPREHRFQKAMAVARLIYGTDRKGRANATNSMIHDVLQEIERIAGC